MRTPGRLRPPFERSPGVYTGIAMAVWRPPVARWQWAVAAFLVVIGFLLVLQLRASRPLREEGDLPTVRARDLAVLVQQQEDARRTLQVEVDNLKSKLLEYKTAAVQGRSAAATMGRDVAEYRLVLGLTPVEGPGAIIRLREQAAPGGVVVPVLQAQDLSGLVNELWAAGAEAIEINGTRLLATTGFRQDDRGIIVGRVRLRPPYQITAIGDPAVMKASLHLRSGFVEGFRAVGLIVEVTHHDHLRLPARPAEEQFRYATPVTR